MSHLLSSCASLRFALWLMCCLPLTAGALGLGDIHVRSAMGQKLDAEIEFSALTAVEAESLTIKLAAPETFVQAGIDYSPVLRSIRFAMVKKGDRQVIQLSSDLAISDPFLNLLIELNTSGNRTLRQYAVLLDPPVIADSPLVVNAPETLAQSDGAPLGKSPLVAETKTAPVAAALIKVPPATAATTTTTTTNTTNTTTATHVVKRGEALAGIAAARREEGASIDQMLLALQRANPQAFVDNNINRLKAGSVLRMPDSDAVRAVDQNKARELIRVQHADFQRYRERLAQQSTQSRDVAAAPATQDERQSGTRSSSGTISQPSQEIPAASVAQDKLKLTAPLAGSKGDQGSAGKQSTQALDQMAADKALEDANARIAALEKNISDLRQLSNVQDSSLADTQAAATTAPDPALVVKETPTLSTPALTPAAIPPPAAPIPETAESQMDHVLQTFLQDPPLMLAGIAGLLLLLIGLGLRYRRRQQTSAEKATESEGVQSIFEQAGGRNIDTSNSVFHSNFVPSVSQLDTNEVDAVAEADVYIAYGRDEQAEEILQDALRLHPDRHALRVKLLEIYVTRKDRQKFGTLAAELRVLTHGVGEAWTQAAQMGVILDPGNLLYGAALRDDLAKRNHSVDQVEAVAGSAAVQPAVVSPVADFEFRLEGLLDERRNVADAATSTATATAIATTTAARQTTSAVLMNAGTTNSVPVNDLSDALEFNVLDSLTSPSLSLVSSAPALKTAGFIAKGTDLASLQTKLDLAIACDEIGDKEGARELLTEVASGPDTELAQRAQSLLSQLA